MHACLLAGKLDPSLARSLASHFFSPGIAGTAAGWLSRVNRWFVPDDSKLKVAGPVRTIHVSCLRVHVPGLDPSIAGQDNWPRSWPGASISLPFSPAPRYHSTRQRSKAHPEPAPGCVARVCRVPPSSQQQQQARRPNPPTCPCPVSGVPSACVCILAHAPTLTLGYYCPATHRPAGQSFHYPLAPPRYHPLAWPGLAWPTRWVLSSPPPRPNTNASTSVRPCLVAAPRPSLDVY